MEAVARPINVENLRATIRLADKHVDAVLEEAELNGEVIPQEVMNFIHVFQDDATRDAIFKAPDKAGIQRIMNDNGVPMDEEDVEGLLAAVGSAGKMLVESDGKLTEEELEQISGGSWLSDAWNSVKSGISKAWNYCTSTRLGQTLTYMVVGAAAMALLFAMPAGAFGALVFGWGGFAVGATMGGTAGAVMGAVGALGADIYD